ncbi:hypothetical protein IIB34_04030 [PVC group bacterium]|nr:hypothetical protein [PVC group bacterium]
MNAKITHIQTALPDNCLTQNDMLDIIRNHIAPSDKAFRLYERFLSDDGILKRYFGWDDPAVLLNETVDEKMNRFRDVAVNLASNALEGAMKETGLKSQDIDGIFIATCTGYLCPGLTSYVTERLSLRNDICVMDLVGQGCSGAIPALQAASNYITSHPGTRVGVIAVEVCSAAIHWGELPELILSNSIFGDGAAAMILTDDQGQRGLKILQIASLLLPQYRDKLCFRYRDSRLCNVISPQVPSIIAEGVKTLCDKLDNNGSITAYAFHGGGRKVLDRIQDTLRLPDTQMNISRQILKDYGNMSSPSVLFALKNVFNAREAQQDQHILAMTFGAGVSIYSLLLQYDA